MESLGFFAAILMGVSLGLIGGGGSILTVPILVYLFAQNPLIATTGSLFIVGSTALVGAVLNARKKLIDFKTGILFSFPSFAGVFVARHLVLPNLPDVIYAQHGVILTKALLVMGAFAVLMVFASRAMIRSGRAIPTVVKQETSLGIIGWNGFLVGVTTGFVGAGGGFLIIPALVIFLKVPMKIAVGTSLAIIAANSLFGFTISGSEHHLDWPVLLKVTAIGVLGIFIGQA
ncbi:MAG: sulfite exporter TauE/SafE family protein, partial [Bdellovibrionaceae bacterium]|nr:sulfite exporter TauE/SafE family protein [Pseudobdellovibrionaceae bacterium]